MSNPQDKILFEDIKRGNIKIYECFFKEYYHKFFSYAYRILKNKTLAEDVVQDVFYIFYINVDAEKIKVSKISETGILSYFYRSVYNKCIDVIRHNQFVAQYKNSESLEFYIDELIQKPDVEEILQKEDLSKILKDALSKLPPRCRQIFTMSKIEYFSVKQIASQLDISEKTVETQMTIAYSRLRKELEWLICLLIFLK